MSTEALRKAVEYADGIFDGCDNGEWATIKQALRDQEAELAAHRADYDALVIRLGEVTARLEAADGLLREAQSFMQCADGHGAASAQLMHRITAHLGGEQ